MQCQFKTVVGPGKYDVENYSIEVSSSKNAAEDVKQYLKDSKTKYLGFFITSMFETDPDTKKAKVIWSIKDKDIDNAIRDIHEMSNKRLSSRLAKKKA